MKQDPVTTTSVQVKPLVSMEYLETDAAEDVKEYAENFLEAEFKKVADLKVKLAEAEAKLAFYQKFSAAQWNHHMRIGEKGKNEEMVTFTYRSPFFHAGAV